MSGNGILLFLVLWPMAGALAAYLIGRKDKRLRCLAADGIVIVEFVIFLLMLISGVAVDTADGFAESSFSWEGFCGMGLNLELDGFRVMYGMIAAFMWMMTTLFSEEYFAHYRNRNRYYLFMLMTLGATAGVFLGADLYTVFIFFEIMSFTSYVWVAHDEKEASMRAAGTYLGVAVIGGMVMLMGLFLLYHVTGTLRIGDLAAAVNAAWPQRKGELYLTGILLLFGFGAKAGMFPLHIWLPKAHPVAPAPASALLSGILTKAGVFGILVVSSNIFLHDKAWGNLMLVIGVITMFGGAMLALFSIDLKRTLACSSMSQIGFILVGVGLQGLLGEENALAVRGTFLHMVNHSLIKLVLFMAAGVVYMNLHKLDLNTIRGFGRKKPLLKVCFLMGALGIGGIPLWNGYVSKTLLHEGIVEYIHLAAEEGLRVWPYQMAEWVFLLSGGITVAYMLKLFLAVFVEQNQDKNVQSRYDAGSGYMNRVSCFALAGAAILLPLMGLFPGIIMDKAADLGQGFMHGTAPAHSVHYFAWVNLKGALISIGIGLLLYKTVVRQWMMVKQDDGSRVYCNRWPGALDLENLLYRPVILTALPAICGAACGVLDRYLLQGIGKALMAVSAVVCRIMDHMVDGLAVLARKTTHKQAEVRYKRLEGDRLAYLMGLFCDDVNQVLNRTLRKKKPVERSYIPRFVEIEEEIIKSSHLIGTSLSFGLMLACAGLCMTLIYLLLF